MRSALLFLSGSAGLFLTELIFGIYKKSGNFHRIFTLCCLASACLLYLFVHYVVKTELRDRLYQALETQNKYQYPIVFILSFICSVIAYNFAFLIKKLSL